MTASAINPATTALPGLAGGGNGQAASPLAGFDALLAALFGEADVAGVVNGARADGLTQAATGAPVIANAQPTVAPLFVGFEDATGLPQAQTDDAALAGEEATDAAAVPDLLAALVAAPTAPAPPVTETTAAAPAAAPDAGKPTAVPAVAPGPADAFAAAPDAEAGAGWANAAQAKAAATSPAAGAAPSVPLQAAAQAAAPAVTQGARQTAAQSAPSAPPPAALTGAPVEVAAKAPEPDPIALALPPEALAQASAQEEITRAADAPPAMPLSKKEKDKKGAVAERTGEATDTPDEVAAPKGGSAATGAAAAATGKGEVAVAKAPKLETPEPEARKADLPEAVEQLQASEGRASTHSAHAPGAAPHAVRGAPETVASLAAQIMKKLDGRSTRFDVELDPIGLGKVDVRVEIGAHGRMTASLSFENPQAAAELKSRSGELQKALEQAGFDLSGGMSFDVAGGQSQARQDWGDGQHGGFRGRAFQQALETANEADLAAASGELRLRRGVTAGVDVRI